MIKVSIHTELDNGAEVSFDVVSHIVDCSFSNAFGTESCRDEEIEIVNVCGCTLADAEKWVADHADVVNEKIQLKADFLHELSC